MHVITLAAVQGNHVYAAHVFKKSVIASATCTASSRVGASTESVVLSAQDQDSAAEVKRMLSFSAPRLGHTQNVAAIQQM